MKKTYFLMLMALVLSLLGCRTENISDTLSDQPHKSNFDASFKEVLKATKSPDENSLMAKVPDFAEGYEPSDFLIDTTKIKKTVKDGEITEYAIYLKKKNETESGVFYNLVFTKKMNYWKKYLVKFTPSIIPETNAKVGYRCEFISKKAQASKCGSSFYMTEYFQCWAGHTDPNDGDCNGCWRLGTYGITNTCDEEAPDDFNGAGDNYGGGVIPNIDGVINAYADVYHWGLYNGLSAENKFKCYQALLLSSDTSYVNFSIGFFYNNPTTTWEQFLYNKHKGEPNASFDFNDNESGNYDETIFENFDFENQQTQWPTIANVISPSDFVGWNAPGIRKNCMDYAKAQFAKKGYKISNYYDVDSQGNKQTFQIYTEQNGVNLNDLYKGVSYIKYALSHGIPVIVGIDDAAGSPGNLDNSTDHFVVIVGMGTDSNGKFFRFYDNASGIDPLNQGANPENKLYYKYPEKIFTGKTYCIDYRNGTQHDYIITMIRKSK